MHTIRLFARALGLAPSRTMHRGVYFTIMGLLFLITLVFYTPLRHGLWILVVSIGQVPQKAIFETSTLWLTWGWDLYAGIEGMSEALATFLWAPIAILQLVWWALAFLVFLACVILSLGIRFHLLPLALVPPVSYYVLYPLVLHLATNHPSTSLARIRWDLDHGKLPSPLRLFVVQTRLRQHTERVDLETRRIRNRLNAYQEGDRP